MNNTPIGAIFSECRQYRYALWRIWDASKPMVQFIGLNPSTANELTDDPTIRRVKAMARSWRFGGVYMTNLFAIVSAYPDVLVSCSDPIKDNDFWLPEVNKHCSKVIFAWGNFKEAVDRAKSVELMFPDAECLHKNKNGSPKHPLYVKGDTIPFKYNP